MKKIDVKNPLCLIAVLTVISTAMAQDIEIPEELNDSYAYRYEYDVFGRQIGVKRPGVNPIRTHYNDLDEVRAIEVEGDPYTDWFKYDKMGRIIMSGTSSGLEIPADLGDTRRREQKSEYQSFGYTAASFPSPVDSSDVNEVIYYDDYAILERWPDLQFEIPFLKKNKGYIETITTRVRGLAVAGATQILGEAGEIKWLRNVDYFGVVSGEIVPIASVADNAAGGIDRVHFKYDPSTLQLLETYSRSVIPDVGTIEETLEYTYYPEGSLMEVTSQLHGPEWTTTPGVETQPGTVHLTGGSLRSARGLNSFKEATGTSGKAIFKVPENQTVTVGFVKDTETSVTESNVIGMKFEPATSEDQRQITVWRDGGQVADLGTHGLTDEYAVVVIQSDAYQVLAFYINGTSHYTQYMGISNWDLAIVGTKEAIVTEVGTSFEETIVQESLRYNAANQLIERNIHRPSGNEPFLRSEDYYYDALNRYAGNDHELLDGQADLGDVFAERLLYESVEYPAQTAMYDGASISAELYKGPADLHPLARVYDYDGLSQLKRSRHARKESDSTWGLDPAFATEYGYDLNQINHLIRNDKDGTPIDYLNYEYNGIFPTKIGDIMSPEMFPDKADEQNEMQYDVQGRLVRDLNYDIDIIQYNRIGYPEVIQMVDQADRIVNQYTAGGSKVRTTVITDGAVTSVTDYIGSSVVTRTDEDQPGHLEMVKWGGGRLRYLNSQWVRDYTITDRQGSVRAIITDQKDSISFLATAEINREERRVEEELFFEGLDDESRVYFPDANHTPTEWGSNMGYVMAVDSGPDGPIRFTYHVYPGDTLAAECYAYFLEKASAPLAPTAATSSLGSGNLLSGAAVNEGSTSLSSGTNSGNLIGFVSGDNNYNLIPTSSMTWRFMDKDGEPISGHEGFRSVTEAANGALEKLVSGELIAPVEGYFVVELRNDDPDPEKVIFFDDFLVTAKHGIVVASTNYYPYGAETWSSSRGSVDAAHRYKYLDQEKISHHGTNYDELGYRNLNTHTGVWWRPEPLTYPGQEFSYAFNDPINLSDASGLNPTGYGANTLEGLSVVPIQEAFPMSAFDGVSEWAFIPPEIIMMEGKISTYVNPYDFTARSIADHMINEFMNTLEHASGGVRNEIESGANEIYNLARTNFDLYARGDILGVVSHNTRFMLNAGATLAGGVANSIAQSITNLKNFSNAAQSGNMYQMADAGAVLIGDVSANVLDYALRKRIRKSKPCGCFTAGTKVIVGQNQDGSYEYKNIEHIAVGDTVLAYNEETGINEYREVTHIMTAEAYEIYYITLENGEVIEATYEHPFYVVGRVGQELEELEAVTTLLQASNWARWNLTKEQAEEVNFLKQQLLDEGLPEEEVVEQMKEHAMTLYLRNEQGDSKDEKQSED